MKSEDILYHYTSIESGNSILNTGKVWASDCRFLNDRNELQKAISILLETVTPKFYECLDLAITWWTSSRVHCIFSLSTSPTVLSQWRAYGNDGRGLALGFKSKFLVKKNKTGGPFLIDCAYDFHEEIIETWAMKDDSWIHDIFETHQKYPAINDFFDALDKRPQAIEQAFNRLLSIKNKEFHEEKEVRLIFNKPAKHAKFRTSSSVMIPYVEHQIFDVEDKPNLWVFIPEIWLGPKCDERNATSLSLRQQLGWTTRDGIKRYDCGYT